MMNKWMMPKSSTLPISPFLQFYNSVTLEFASEKFRKDVFLNEKQIPMSLREFKISRLDLSLSFC